MSSIEYGGSVLSNRVNDSAVAILGVDSGWTLDSELNRTHNGALKNKNKFNKFGKYNVGNNRMHVILECTVINTSDGKVFIDYIGGRVVLLNSNHDVVLGWACDCRTRVDFGNNTDLAIQSIKDFEIAVADNIKVQFGFSVKTEFSVKVKNANVIFYKLP